LIAFVGKDLQAALPQSRRRIVNHISPDEVSLTSGL
jgi:hypothetical protein